MCVMLVGKIEIRISCSARSVVNACHHRVQSLVLPCAMVTRIEPVGFFQYSQFLLATKLQKKRRSVLTKDIFYKLSELVFQLLKPKF